MRDYSTIYWERAKARLKSYAAATRGKGGAIVKLEIEVSDPGQLGRLLEDIAAIQQDQAAAAKPPAKPRKPATPPRLLTYRGGE